MTTIRRMASRQVGLTATFLALAAGGAAACDIGSDYDDTEYVQENRRFHCAADINGQPQAVDCKKVTEDPSGNGFVYVGGSSHPVYVHSAPAKGTTAYVPGQKLPPGYKIGYADADARTRAGLPPRGPVANNTVKTGVVGKGGAPAPRGAKGSGG